jgi:hypothetical protein
MKTGRMLEVTPVSENFLQQKNVGGRGLQRLGFDRFPLPAVQASIVVGTKSENTTTFKQVVAGSSMSVVSLFRTKGQFAGGFTC